MIRSSLRETIRLLEFQGLIRVRPGAGAVVGPAELENFARTMVLYRAHQRAYPIESEGYPFQAYVSGFRRDRLGSHRGHVFHAAER